MNDYKKAFKAFFIMMLILLIGTLTVSSLLAPEANPGVVAVKLMYQFDDVNDLPAQYKVLQKIISEDDFEKLSIDNELRVVNTYFKFNAMPAKVRILRAADGFVAYNIISDSQLIEPSTVWIFKYEKHGNKLSNIREYRCAGQTAGGAEEFDWNSVDLGGTGGTLPVRIG